MSWPHLLSLSRILAAAPIAALILTGNRWALYTAAAVFACASLTDLLDGPLARRGRTVGPLGVYLDTTADKAMVSVVLVALAVQHFVDPWMTMMIIAREFLISGVRTLAAVQGFVIGANLAGKLKTTVTLVAMVGVMLVAGIGVGSPSSALRSAGWYAMLVATLLTCWSGITYIRQVWPLFFPDRRQVLEMGPEAARTGERPVSK